MNAIIYTRVSTDEQAKSGYSLPHQQTILSTYCKFNKINILKHYQEDYSAKDFDNRPEFSKLLDYVKVNKKNVDQILFTRWDRFSRNQEQALKIIRELKDLGIQVNAVEQPLDMTQPDSKVMLSVYLVIPEVENDKNSIRTRAGMRKAMRMGCFMGIAPRGYINSRNIDGHSTLNIDSAIAPFISAAFEDFSLGIYSAEEVRKKYYKLGLKISKQGFLNLLKNPVYLGKIVVPEWQKEEMEIVTGYHEAIVDELTYNKVQVIFAGKKTKVSLKRRDDEFPLRNHLICDCCGKKLTASFSKSRNGNKYAYYHGNTGCKARFRADFANECFLNFLGQFQLKPEIGTLYLTILKDVFCNEEKNRDKQKEKLQTQINNLNHKLESLTDKFIDDKLDQVTYRRTKSKIDAEISQAEFDLNQINTEREKLDVYIEFGISFLTGLKNFYETSTVKIKRQIVGSIFPESLIFLNEKYRTTQLNSFVEILFSNSRELETLENRKAGISTGLSRKAPPLGLEPRTL